MFLTLGPPGAQMTQVSASLDGSRAQGIISSIAALGVGAGWGNSQGSLVGGWAVWLRAVTML